MQIFSPISISLLSLSLCHFFSSLYVSLCRSFPLSFSLSTTSPLPLSLSLSLSFSTSLSISLFLPLTFPFYRSPSSSLFLSHFSHFVYPTLSLFSHSLPIHLFKLSPCLCISASLSWYLSASIHPLFISLPLHQHSL